MGDAGGQSWNAGRIPEAALTCINHALASHVGRLIYELRLKTTVLWRAVVFGRVFLRWAEGPEASVEWLDFGIVYAAKLCHVQIVFLPVSTMKKA